MLVLLLEAGKRRKDMTKKRLHRIEVLRLKASWFWHIVAQNNEVLVASEVYSSKAKAIKTARGIAKLFKEGVVELKIAG
jgi:uncharacterized protein YegP (UPF0339 family)